MADLSGLIGQLNNVSGDLVKAAEGVKLADVTKDFSDTLDAVITKLQAVSRDTGGGGAVFVHAFDELIAGSLAEFVKLSVEVGGDVKTQCDLVQAAFKAQREFLATVAECKAPTPNVLQSLLKPTSEQLAATQEFREKNRRSPQFNHLSAVSEGIPALGWVTISKPAPYVKELANAAQFYSNRVLKEFKDTDKKQADCVKAFLKVLGDLGEYAAQHHQGGIAWNSKGKDASGAAPAPAAPAGGAPPPPPPGPPPPPEVTPATGSGAGDDGTAAQAALFSEINKGGAVTSHLKKVTPDMQTHKNPNLRQAGPAPSKTLSGPKPYKAPSSTSKVSAPGAKTVVKKTPKTELEGKKWNVEYHEGNRDIVIEGNMKQTIYVYKCTGSTIQVKGKINSITLDGCKKTALVFENVLGTVDFINCQSVQAQVTGMVPIVSVDKTDGFQLYLSKESVSCSIVTAKSSEMNVLIPKDDDSGEYSEHPVPEQFKTTWDGKKLVTDCTESV